MKRISLILLVLLTPLFQACLRDKITLATAELGLYIECPGVPEDTKVSEGEVSAKNRSEYAVHSLQVWLFTSEFPHELIEYMDLSAGQLPSAGRVRRYAIQVTPEFAQERPHLDVFAIANGESVGCTLDGNSSWIDLKAAVFGNDGQDDWFGVSNPVREVSPTLGLPMTGAGRDLAIQGDEPVLKIETVKLKRAVSKVRYVFCRMKDEDVANPDIITVDNVTLGGSLIPNTEYLFTNGTDYSIVPNNYDPHSLETTNPEALAKNDTPERLTFASGDSAEGYEALIDAAILNGTLTDYGTIYLRESDQMLSGTITYTINGQESVKNFNMAAPGDFVRNRTWTLYGYFLSGRNLQIAVSVLPWDYTSYNINFSDETVVVPGQFSIDGSTVSMKASSHPDFDTDVHLLSGVTAKAHFYISAPKGGKVSIQPHGDVGAFIVTPTSATINPDVNSGRVDIEIRSNPNAVGDLAGKYIWLTFHLELGEREADLESEILNGSKYRFIL